MSNKKGQSVVQMAIGVGMFVFILSIFALLYGEAQTSLEPGTPNATGAYTNINETFEEGRNAMQTGSKFGTVFIVLGILGVAIAIFGRMQGS